MAQSAGRSVHSSPRTRRYFTIPTLRAVPETALLRARGGISHVGYSHCNSHFSSPRTRRYFHPGWTATHRRVLFSAHAEVFPAVDCSCCSLQTLLRARGGISKLTVNGKTSPSSSPRTRRYFPSTARYFLQLRLFSAHAEVFPQPKTIYAAREALLRARGGISDGLDGAKAAMDSSPRTRRYFQIPCLAVVVVDLFSAHAEVFPSYETHAATTVSLLRARGGISDKAAPFTLSAYSSPRTRRYFRL